MIDVSIIILNYRNKRMVRQCVTHLVASAPTVAYEVIVVDNDSRDDSLAYFEHSLPRETRVLANPLNGGYSYGNNRGIEKASGRYLLIMNPDIIVEDNAIDRLVDFMDQHPSVGLAGPKLLNPNRTLQYSATRFPRWYMPLIRRTRLGNTTLGKRYSHRYLMKAWNHRNNTAVESLFGACLIVRRDALKDVGTLDERFFMYMEDIDWCRRFWEKQWEVWYVAHVAVVHFHGRGSQSSKKIVLLDKLTRHHIQSWIKLLWKWRGKKHPVNIDPTRVS